MTNCHTIFGMADEPTEENKATGQRIKIARIALGLTQAELGQKVGQGQSTIGQWERGRNPPSYRMAEKLADIFKCDPSWILFGAGEQPGGRLPQSANRKPLVNHAGDSIPSEAEGEPERNARLGDPFTGQLVDRRLPYIPVHGTAEAGPDGRFEMNTGDTIDHIPTPPKLANAKGLYAIYVDGDSMIDAFEPGDPAIVNPHIPPKIRDYVVIFLRHGHEESAPKGFLKRLVRRTADRVIVEQLHPPKEMEFKLADIQVMHRVYRPAELIMV